MISFSLFFWVSLIFWWWLDCLRSLFIIVLWDLVCKTFRVSALAFTSLFKGLVIYFFSWTFVLIILASISFFWVLLFLLSVLSWNFLFVLSWGLFFISLLITIFAGGSFIGFWEKFVLFSIFSNRWFFVYSVRFCLRNWLILLVFLSV